MAFAGVNIEEKIAGAGLEGASAAAVESGAPAADPESAPESKDPAAELEALAGDDPANPADPADPASRAAEAAKINEFLDFEANKTKKVKIGSEEMTLADLHKGFMRQQDFTRKTQELAQDRKYRDNLNADLEKIAGDATLLTEFKRLYPASFHKAAELVARTGKAPSEATPVAGDQSSKAQADPELLARLARLEGTEHERQAKARELEVQSHEQEIESTMKELAPKFPFADDETVLAKASSLLSVLRSKAVERGEDPAKVGLTKQHWERVYKLTHEQSEARYKQHYEAQRKKQMSAHDQGRDVPAGGGLPGQAPKKMKLGDVADHMIASLSAQGSAGAP